MLKPTAIVELVMQDASGSTSAITLHQHSSLDYSEIDAFATAAASILLPLTGAVLVGQRIKYINVPSEPVTATGGASILRAAAFFFNTPDDRPMAIELVRAIKASAIISTGVTDGVAIDTGDSDVIAFINAVIDSGITNVFGDVIASFDTAYLQSRI